MNAEAVKGNQGMGMRIVTPNDRLMCVSFCPKCKCTQSTSHDDDGGDDAGNDDGNDAGDDGDGADDAAYDDDSDGDDYDDGDGDDDGDDDGNGDGDGDSNGPGLRYEGSLKNSMDFST